MKNQIVLSQISEAQAVEIFHTALCNGLSGLSYHGLQFEYVSSEYKISRAKLAKEACYEDVLIQMLKDGYKLSIEDIEGGGEYNRSITLKDIYKKISLTPLVNITNIIQENDDAYDADAVLQSVFLGSIIFG